MISLRADYSDNPRFLATSDKAARGAIVDTAIGLAWRDETTALTARPRIRAARYADYPLLNADDQSLELALAQSFDTSQISFSASALRDHTLTSELETTGFVEANKPHRNYNLGASAQWQATERTLLGTQLSYDANDYERDPLRQLIDYQYPSVSLYGRRQLNERTSLTVTASAGGIRGSDVPVESNNYSVRIGLDRNWSERWTASLAVGPSLVTRPAAPSSQGVVYSASVAHASERTRWQAKILHEVRPAGRGTLENRDEIGLSGSHFLTETLSADAGLRLIRSEESYSGLFFSYAQRRSYGRVEAGLGWHWRPQWTLGLTYAYSQQHYESGHDDPSAHQLGATVSWTVDRWALSR